jgi:hypothetical protein
MKLRLWATGSCILWKLLTPSLEAAPFLLDPGLQLRKVMNTGAASIRLAWNPDDQHLYYLKITGQIYRVDLSNTPDASTSVRLYDQNDHQITSAAGMVIDSAGTIYLTSNRNVPDHTVSTVTRGVLNRQTGIRNWSVLAETQPYPSESRLFNHQLNAIALSPDGQSLLVNLGARTDHGEIQSDSGNFPGIRETGLTAIILQLPTAATGLVLPNHREQLRQAGYLYCEGVRNTYDLAFSPQGDLFGAENGPDRDMPEELNWLRKGHHYGFPWRMGLENNPQQFAFYDPAADLLLNNNYLGVIQGTYQNDPTFPPPPPGVQFTNPILNTGPDADWFRDNQTGTIQDASIAGLPIGSFTAHRCPVGLVFDSKRKLPPGYRGDAFLLSWTEGQNPGQNGAGAFDESEDLLHLKLNPAGQDYQLSATRIAAGFTHPIDTEITGTKLYVLENGGSQGLWEITFPPQSPFPVNPVLQANGDLRLSLGGVPGDPYLLESSPDLITWTLVQRYTATESPIILTLTTTGLPRQFYRARPAE